MKHILEMTCDDLTAELQGRGLPRFRGRQVFEWIWAKRVADLNAMTNLSKDLRSKLAKSIHPTTSRIVRRRDAEDGVSKLLLEFTDGDRIETVLIPTREGETASPRRTACISTQVGCAMGCVFCASGLDGLRRDLTAGEIVEQVFQWDISLGDDLRVTHVVLMGMGEPLANYDATIAAIGILIDPDRGGLSARHITLSTVGLPHRMRQLAREGIPLTLAVSLHAPNDELRQKLIPAAKGMPIADLIAAGNEYFSYTGRELTLEYVLLAGVNDSTQCAEELAHLTRKLRCNVNLIRYNTVEGLSFDRPAERAVLAFRDQLRRRGANVQIRASRGADAEAACGQLRQTSVSP